MALTENEEIKSVSVATTLQKSASLEGRISHLALWVTGIQFDKKGLF
jgi:hypothetical protein